MNEGDKAMDFTAKFNELTEQNQKYIIAIQQALIFAQSASANAENGLVLEKTVSLNHVS